MTSRAAVHRRDGKRVTRFADDDYVQTRYNLRSAEERYDTRDEDDYDYEQGRRKASRPSPRVGQRRARSPSPVYARSHRGSAPVRRETGGAAMARHRPVEDYVTHPLDDFDRYMLARRERGARPREHMRPAAREMERIAYMSGRRRQGSPHEAAEGEEEGDEYRYSGDFSEDDVDYDRFRAQRHHDQGEQDRGEVRRRGRQMTRRSDLVQRGGGGRDRRYEGEEEEEGEEGYDDHDDYGLERGESDEGEGLMSAPDALDQDEEYITGRRMPVRTKRRLHDYDEEEDADADAVRRAYGRRAPQQQQRQPQNKRRRRDEEEEEDEEEHGLMFTVGEEELEEEPQQRGRRRMRTHEAEEDEGEEAVQRRRKGRKLPSRKTHRHPTYEDMIAEALVKVGKNGKASGVAIFKYVHDHFDMPANDRLVRNHLHQAFERLIDSGQLRHKKASYVLPRNLLAQYDAKYGAKKDEENKEEGEKKPDEGGDQGAQKEGQEAGTAAKKAHEGEAIAEKDASAGERQQQQQQEKKTAPEEKADAGETSGNKSEETTVAASKKGGRKKSR